MRDLPLEGRILLNIERTFQGSVFTMAKISSIKFYELVPNNPASYEILDVSSTQNGELLDATTIAISFSYLPSYQQLTTHLQNWAQGFYIEVTVDVSFYSPQGLYNKKSIPDSPLFNTVVRAQIPNFRGPRYLKQDSVHAISSNIHIKKEDVEKAIEEHKLIAAKIHTDKVNNDLKLVKDSNQKMIYFTIAAGCACVVVSLISALVIYSIRKSNNQQN